MRLRVAFMGSPDFAVPSLQATAKHCDVKVVVTQPDRPAGRGRKLTPPAVKVAAQELGLPVWQPQSVKDSAFLSDLRALDIDLAVVVAYGQIFPQELLDLPKFGCVNVHASLLPKWRGAAPIQRALLAGDRVTGICLMKLEAGCDTGPVFVRESVVIDDEESCGDLFHRLSLRGAKALGAFLENFEARPKAQPQDPSLATHAAKLRKEEGLVDWTRSAKLVSCHIRGMDPWPAATTTWQPEGQSDAMVLKLFRSVVAPRNAPWELSEPGQIVGIEDDKLWVACGEGFVAIRELQAPGKKRLGLREFLAGHPMSIGERLGAGSEPG